MADDREYLEAFDRFEYLASLVYADQAALQGEGVGWAPIGCFGWRRGIVTIVDREIQNEGQSWPAFRLFGGSGFDRLNASRDVVARLTPGFWG